MLREFETFWLEPFVLLKQASLVRRMSPCIREDSFQALALASTQDLKRKPLRMFEFAQYTQPASSLP